MILYTCPTCGIALTEDEFHELHDAWCPKCKHEHVDGFDRDDYPSEYGEEDEMGQWKLWVECEWQLGVAVTWQRGESLQFRLMCVTVCIGLTKDASGSCVFGRQYE